jgi:hypothetical protein
MYAAMYAAIYAGMDVNLQSNIRDIRTWRPSTRRSTWSLAEFSRLSTNVVPPRRVADFF